MTPSKVVSTVESCGIPCAHFCFPKGSAPSLPWAVYYLEDSNGFIADNSTYTRGANWVVELYEKSMNTELELKIEQAIEKEFGPCSINEVWIEEENCLQKTYRFTEI